MQKLSPFKRLLTVPTTFQSISVIIILGVFVYFNSFLNGFVGDDDMQILNNPAVHSITAIPRLFLESTFYKGGIVAGGLYYNPLLSASFSLLYTLFAPQAAPFHILQVI